VSSFLFISTPTSSGRKKLEDLDSSTLIDLIKDYMVENEDLRRNNYEQLTVRDMIMRDQEMVCIENERLIKKVEECEQ
jgi:kinesin family protein 12